MMRAQIDELQRVRGLSSGLDWILMCPDPRARQALLQLVAEEISVTVDAVAFAIQAKAQPKLEAEEEIGGQG